MQSCPNMKEAEELLREYNKSDALIKHAFAVSGVMRHFAKLAGADEEKWAVVGLLHDLDYEMYPEEHCTKSEEIMKEKGIDEEYIRAVKSHGYGLCSDVEPISGVEKTLFAIDELTGLINAACLMRPSKSVLDIELKSVKKKYKTPSFAAGVDRSIIEKGCAALNVELDYLIQETIMGMRACAAEIGLVGEVS